MDIGYNRDGQRVIMPPKDIAHCPYAPAQFTLPQGHALQAMSTGEASPEQQIMALKWIVNEVCKKDDMSYRPESERDSNFAEGKRYVGLQIAKMTQLNLALYKEKDDG